jgi:hypothetical protein
MNCQTMTTTTPEIGCGSYNTLVLADAGSDLWLVRARFNTPPEIGTQFSFQGIDWQIDWSCETGYGARPAQATSAA